jgi:hypothetical protein
MELIGKLFNDYKIIIYYDDSEDNSLNKLKEYQAKNDKMHLYVNKTLLPYRTHRIALGRNTCLEMIKKMYSDYPFFIMMDCDDRCARDLNIDLLKNYLNTNSWDCLTFNYPGVYYDTWALSKIPHVLSCHHFKDGNDRLQKMITKLINKTPSNELIQCLSAFNGIAIYKTDKFINCYYDGRCRYDYIPGWMKNIHIKNNPHIIPQANLVGDLKYEDCEHRHFHIQAVLENNARIRISPQCLFI